MTISGWKKPRREELMNGKDPGRASLLSRALDSDWIPPGLFFIALGTAALWVSRDYPMGDLNRMGPGYFPRVLSIGMICLGLLIVRQGWSILGSARGLRAGLDRSFWLVPLALIVFGISVERLGVVLGLLLTLAVAGAAHREARIKEIAVSIGTLIVLVVLIFVIALKLPLRLWPEF